MVEGGRNYSFYRFLFVLLTEDNRLNPDLPRVLKKGNIRGKSGFAVNRGIKPYMGEENGGKSGFYCSRVRVNGTPYSGGHLMLVTSH